MRLACCWLGSVPEVALGPAGMLAPATAAQERAPEDAAAARSSTRVFELSDFVDKLGIVIDECLLVLSDLFGFALKVPDGLSLLPDDLGQGDKQIFVGRGAPPGSRVGLAAFNRDGVGVVG